METIFDHKITEDELKWLLNRPYTLEEYLNLGGSVNDHFVHIAKLYYHRGKRFKARRYINKVTNPNQRNSFWRTVSHMHNTTQQRYSFSFLRLLKKLKKIFS